MSATWSSVERRMRRKSQSVSRIRSPKQSATKPPVHAADDRAQRAVRALEPVALHDVDRLRGAADERRELSRIELAVAVGVEDPLLARRCEPRNQLAAVAPIAFVRHHPQCGLPLRERGEHFRRVVGRAVIDDDHLVVGDADVAQCREHDLDHVRDGRLVVVTREEDRDRPDADAELDRGIPLPRARIMGGCSATNACFALRGAPQDYDGWAALGNPVWSFTDVLDDFRGLERDADFHDQWHGSDGLIPIRRHPRSEMNAVQAAFLDGVVASGHQYVEDHNRPGVVGAGPTPRTARDGMRMSTALTYLARARSRANLSIRPDTTVARVECSGTRAIGIRLLDGTLIEADRVVLAAGTYASPMILARSGIGPTADLQALVIAAVVELPGVGSNLADHPLISIDLPTRPSPGPSRFQAHVTFHSAAADRAGPADLLLFAAGPFEVGPDQSATGAVFGIVAGLMAPRSRGWVRLASSNPTDAPKIHPAHLTDPDDLERMLDAVTEARRLANSEPVAAITTGTELSPEPGFPTEDRDALGAWVRSAVSTFHHPVGTCTMGADPALGAVTDSRGSVHGIEGLTIADASIMPTIPTATTNLPTIMVAEHIARWLRST
jgi:choline dehydrogenase